MMKKVTIAAGNSSYVLKGIFTYIFKSKIPLHSQDLLYEILNLLYPFLFNAALFFANECSDLY